MITKELQLVTFEQAKKLDELGFNWEVSIFYDTSGNQGRYDFIPANYNKYHEKRYTTSAPIVVLALKWFRDVKNITYSIAPTSQSKKGCTYAYDLILNFKTIKSCSFKSYEQAESELLDKLLELCVNKTK